MALINWRVTAARARLNQYRISYKSRNSYPNDFQRKKGNSHKTIANKVRMTCQLLLAIWNMMLMSRAVARRGMSLWPITSENLEHPFVSNACNKLTSSILAKTSQLRIGLKDFSSSSRSMINSCSPFGENADISRSLMTISSQSISLKTRDLLSFCLHANRP
jgi:hypothetical protein